MYTKVFASLNFRSLIIVSESREVLDCVIEPEVALSVVEELTPLHIALVHFVHSASVLHGELRSIPQVVHNGHDLERHLYLTHSLCQSIFVPCVNVTIVSAIELSSSAEEADHVDDDGSSTG